MIFPEYTSEEWIKKYPSLEIKTVLCRHCTKELKTDTPYLSRDYAGLCIKDDKCIHCGKRHRAHISIPISQREQSAWRDAFSLK